jgi:hypothetical protein
MMRTTRYGYHGVDVACAEADADAECTRCIDVMVRVLSCTETLLLCDAYMLVLTRSAVTCTATSSSYLHKPKR